MKLVKSWFLFVLALAILAGCSRNPSEPAPRQAGLVGEYGYADPKTGSITPLIKIEASKEEPAGFVLYEAGKKGWVRPSRGFGVEAKVKRFEKADLEKAVKKTVTVEVDGVMAGGIALVQVPAGWSDDAKAKPFKTASGYFALTLLGPVDLVRIGG